MLARKHTRRQLIDLWTLACNKGSDQHHNRGSKQASTFRAGQDSSSSVQESSVEEARVQERGYLFSEAESSPSAAAPFPG